MKDFLFLNCTLLNNFVYYEHTFFLKTEDKNESFKSSQALEEYLITWKFFMKKKSDNITVYRVWY